MSKEQPGFSEQDIHRTEKDARITELLKEVGELKEHIAEHDMVEELLRSEKDKLQALIDGLSRTNVGIDIVGIDYRIYFQNKTLQDRFGDLTGELCYEKYMKQKEPCQFCPLEKSMRNNSVESTEIVDREGRFLQLLSAPFANPDGTIDKAVEVVVDITERKNVEKRLLESESMFRSIVENSHAGIFIIDNSFHITYANNMLGFILGYLPEEIVDRDFRTLLDEDSKKMVADRYIRRQKGEDLPSRYEFGFVRKDGVTRKAELSTSVVRDSSGKTVTVGQMLDITERKEAEIELQEAHEELESRVKRRTVQLLEANALLQQEIEEHKRTQEALQLSEIKYRHLIENANSVILEMDTRGNILFFNKYAQEFFGYSEEEILGRSVVGTIVPLRDAAGKDLEYMIKDIVTNPVKYLHNENENVCRDGKRVWIVWTNQPIYDENGLLKEILCIGINRTEQKEAEELIAQQVKEKTMAEERSRLARDLHDAVSQTLFSASLIAEVLPRIWVRNQEEGVKRLEEIRVLTRGALAEMRTLLLELRPSALMDAELGDLLKQLGETIIGRARVSVAVQVNGQCILKPETKIALYRIAQEALNNVAKHSGATRAKVSLNCQTGRVELIISDNGKGFDTKAAFGKSFGLGIMQERARKIGACINLSSIIGKGTDVSIIWSEGQEEKINE